MRYLLVLLIACGSDAKHTTVPSETVCRPQVCGGEGDCDAIVLQMWSWNGSACVFVEDSGCSVRGPDCRNLYNSQSECAAATSKCVRDIALVGGAGWNTIPIAFNTGGGNWNVTNQYVGDFAAWAASAGARPVTADFNRDGMTDIALVGGPNWTTLPVAFSYGDGRFLVTNSSSNAVSACGGFEGQMCSWNFAARAREANAQTIVGDFNRDGFTDIALVGANRSSIAVALSYGNGYFAYVDRMIPNFPQWAASSGVKIVSGDFNGDGWTDIALTGVAGWNTIPVASGKGFGDFTVTNVYVSNFPYWSSLPNVRVLVGDFNKDGWADLALTGGSGWTSIVVGFSIGSGTFVPVNTVAKRFPQWASDPAGQPIIGKLN